MTVVEFPKPPEPEKSDLVWVCECGCSTFYLHSDGAEECAHCGKRATDFQAQWRPDPRRVVPADDSRMISVVGLDEVGLARSRREIMRPGVVLVVLAYDDGRVHTWADMTAEDVRRIEWAQRRLADAAAMFRFQKPPSLHQEPQPGEAGDKGD